MGKGCIVNIQAEKIRLIAWLAGLNNAKILNEFISLKKTREEDWWGRISAEEKSETEEGLAQADRGEVVSHAQAMATYKKWL